MNAATSRYKCCHFTAAMVVIVCKCTLIVCNCATLCANILLRITMTQLVMVTQLLLAATWQQLNWQWYCRWQQVITTMLLLAATEQQINLQWCCCQQQVNYYTVTCSNSTTTQIPLAATAILPLTAPPLQIRKQHDIIGSHLRRWLLQIGLPCWKEVGRR